MTPVMSTNGYQLTYDIKIFKSLTLKFPNTYELKIKIKLHGIYWKMRMFHHRYSLIHLIVTGNHGGVPTLDLWLPEQPNDIGHSGMASRLY